MRPGAGYRFGPLERRGLLGGAAAGQALPVVAALLAAIVVLDLSPTPGGLVAAVGLIVAALVAARFTLAGRAGHEWLGVSMRFLTRRGRGRTVVLSDAHQRGHRLEGVQVRQPTPQALPHLERVELTELVHAGRRLGVLLDRRLGHAVAVLTCRASPLSLLDGDARERRLRGWGTLLSTLSGSPLRRLQWVERTLPAQGDDLARWLHEQRDPSIGERGCAMLESYLELISSSTRVAQEHEVLLALQAPVTGRRGDTSLAQLGEQVESVSQLLQGAEVQVLGALERPHLSLLLRTAFDPFARAEAALSQAAPPAVSSATAATAAAATPEPAHARPAASRETWGEFACDGAVHSTYWISGWPRTEVSPLFLDALLGPSRAVRAVSVCFQPLPPERSTREVEAALTRDRADQHVRARLGQLETARHRQGQEAALRREQELAAGHAELRFSGFVTVSGRDQEELRRASREVLEQAARARLELRRLYGQQAEAFTFTLPLCRGLR